MKKCIVILLVAATIILCLAGCGGKRATAVVTFDNFENGNLVAFPRQNGSSAGLERNVLTVNVTADGVYPFLISANDTEYSFILTYENGKFAAEADTDLTFNIK